MQKVTRLTYSIEEVSRILGISRSHAYKAVETGEQGRGDRRDPLHRHWPLQARLKSSTRRDPLS